jgi:dATP/dGTP diphosphohydrolase
LAAGESVNLLPPCRGGTCDSVPACFSAGRCLYRSSADEAREFLTPARTTGITQEVRTTLPVDSLARKDIPLARGLLDYFPAALAAVAELSRVGNDKHNPGEPLHWARGKSSDHADCIMRHLSERGTIDTDGLSHSVKVAWRALALLQEELEAAGAPKARGAK